MPKHRGSDAVRRQHTDDVSLGAAIAALGDASYGDLRLAWRRHFRVDPPKKLGRDMLELGIAWKLQQHTRGGLSAVAKRQLSELSRTMIAKRDLAKSRRVMLRPGARLMRAWRGETHEVLVVEDGFLWRGQTWASLSAIAREMTGTHWSGPRFFGLDASAPSEEARHDDEDPRS